MTLFRILLALALSLASPAAAEKLSLDRISGYFNSFRTAVADFVQINTDGTQSTGRLYIRRPGRVRFEYDPPVEVLVIADGSTVGIIDGKSNTGPEGYPLHRTPLKIILARTVDLGRERMVIGHDGGDGTTTVRAQDPDNPEYGSIDLVFSNDPVALRRWVIHDDTGGSTTIILGKLETGVRIAASQFEIPGGLKDRLQRRD